MTAIAFKDIQPNDVIEIVAEIPTEDNDGWSFRSRRVWNVTVFWTSETPMGKKSVTARRPDGTKGAVLYFADLEKNETLSFDLIHRPTPPVKVGDTHNTLTSRQLDEAPDHTTLMANGVEVWKKDRNGWGYLNSVGLSIGSHHHGAYILNSGMKLEVIYVPESSPIQSTD